MFQLSLDMPAENLKNIYSESFEKSLSLKMLREFQKNW